MLAGFVMTPSMMRSWMMRRMISPNCWGVQHVAGLCFAVVVVGEVLLAIVVVVVVTVVVVVVGGSETKAKSYENCFCLIFNAKIWLVIDGRTLNNIPDPEPPEP